MDCLKTVQNLKNEVLEEVSRAVEVGESQRILLLGRRLEMIDKLTVRAEELESDVKNLLVIDEKSFARKDSSAQRGVESGREGGERARAVIVNALSAAGVEIQRLKGAIYRLPTGALLGIAYATERQPNRWFLGLTKGKFEHAILLCEETPDKIHALVLSQDFLTKHGKLSSSGSGEKFNVTRTGSSFYLNFPGKGAVPVPKLDVFSPNIENLLAKEA